MLQCAADMLQCTAENLHPTIFCHLLQNLVLERLYFLHTTGFLFDDKLLQNSNWHLHILPVFII